MQALETGQGVRDQLTVDFEKENAGVMEAASKATRIQTLHSEGHYS